MRSATGEKLRAVWLTALLLVAPIAGIPMLSIEATAAGNDALPISESFDGPEPSDWLTTGNADWAESEGGESTLGLTDATTDQAGSALYTTPFSSTNGITAEFRYYADEGTGADGFTFFLLDESDLSGGFTASDIGDDGGALGYGDTGSGGIKGGFVGVGFDEYGNFDEPGYGGSAGGDQEITIRGSTDTTEAPVVATNDLSSNTVDGGWQRARVTVDPTAGTTSEVEISVYVDFEEDGTYIEIFAPTLYNLGTDIDEESGRMPSDLRIGFSGSTGGSTNVHAIDDLTVTKPADLTTTVTGQPAGGPYAAGDTVEYTFDVSNNGPNDDPGVTLDPTVATGASGLENRQWDTDNDDSFDDDTGGTTTISLASGDTRTVQLRATVGDSATGDLHHEIGAVTSGDNNDPSPSDANASVTIDLVAAPTFASGDSLSSITEDLDPASNDGARIDSNELLGDEFADADGDGFAGVVVTDDAATASEGTWQYSTDDGATWDAVDDGSLSAGNGLALSGATALRFDPATDFSGSPGDLTVRAVDDSAGTSFTSGSTRETVDTTADGAASGVANAGVAVGISVTGVDDPATLSATSGNSEYTVEGSAVVVDGDLSVTDPDTGTVDGATVSIDDGFAAGEDSLGWDGSVASDNGVSGSYDSKTGVLTFSGTATASEWQAVLRTVTYDNTNLDPSTADREITFSLGSNSLYSPNTGHYYEFVTDSGIDWDAARTAAAGRTYFGLQGYLVTVTSQAENDFVASKLSGEGWMGATDRASEGTWRWVTGPEGTEESGAGRHFFTQTGSNDGHHYGTSPGGGNTVDDEYANWASAEPNDYNSGEDRAHFLTDGDWNDYANGQNAIEGYVVEYGGSAGDPSLQLSDQRTVTLADPTPTVSSYSVTNPSSQDVTVSFDATDQLSTIAVSISGTESATLSLSDFTETDNGDGTYTYDATYSGSTDGDYTATLDTAADGAGNDGASGESETLAVHAVAPTISSYSVTTPSGQDVAVSFDSTDQLSTVGVSVSGAETATLSLSDLTETDNGDGTYTYDATYSGSTDGDYTATLDSATDAGSNDGAGGESATVTVDTGIEAIAAGSDRTVDVGTSVTLDASGSSDGNGITAYRWDFDDDGTVDATGQSVTHDFFAPETHTVSLTVVDGAGSTATDTLTVTVRPKHWWSSFHGDAASIGHNANGTGPQTPVEEAWRVDLDSYVVMNPALVDGTIYFGEYRGQFYAVSASDGSTEWTFDPTQGKHNDGFGWSSPAVVDGTVYIGSRSGHVYAVDADTGSKDWEYDTGSYRIESSPVVIDGTVYIGDAFGTLHALDAATGTQDWAFQTAENERYHSNAIESNPVVVDDTVFFANDDGEVFAVDASTGTQQWTHDLGNWTQSDPTVTGNTVYIGDGRGNVYALNASDGTERWQHALDSRRYSGGVSSSPAYADGTLYVTDERGNVTALDTADGSEMWQRQTGDTSKNRYYYYYRSSIHSAPIVVDGTVYVTQTDDGAVYAFDATDGTQEWVYDADIRYLYATPVVDDGLLYYGGYQGFAALGESDTPPTAEAGTSITTPEDAQLTFDGSESADDDSIASYAWDFGDGTTATGASPSHSYAQSGEYTVTLTVTDTAGQTDTDAVSVTVTENSVLVADAGRNGTADEDTAVDFDASDSRSNEGGLTYAWDFDGDGTTDATDATPTHTFTDPGTYAVGLTLTDAEGNEARDTRQMLVTDTTAPTAVAGSDVTVENGDTVGFDASGSTDNGDLMAYRWDFDDGEIATGIRAAHTFDDPGTYNVTVSVADADGNVGTDERTVTVTDTTAPRADAGSDITAPEDGDVSFDGTGSTDDDTVASYAWDFDGDGTTDATDATPAHTFTQSGTFTTVLTATDPAGNAGTDDLTVTVTETSVLIGDAGANLTVGAGETAQFDATGTKSNEGGLTYAWDFDDDGTTDATGATPTQTFTAVGIHEVSATITDAEGNAATDSLWVTVEDTTDPTADAGSAITTAQGDSVSFDGRGSSDDTQIASYQWDLNGDGAFDAVGATPTTTYDAAGTVTAELLVTDAAGNTATDTLTLTVADATDPSADAGANKTADEETAIRFDAGRSTDNVGITSYAWDFDGDSTTDATGATPTHTYAEPGTQTVTLTVTDAAGNTATDALTTTVRDATAPTAQAGSNTSVDEDVALSFDASGSTDNGVIAGYAWDFDNDSTTDATGVSPTHAYATPGTYTATVIVTDGDGNTDADTRTVTVRDTTAPVVDAGEDRTVAAGRSVSFDGTGTTDDSAIASYEWDLDDDGTIDATGASAKRFYTDAGTYSVTLTVTDAAGNTATDTAMLSVEDRRVPNVDPGSARTVEIGTSVAFDASGSTDRSGIASYAWDFDGDGATDATGVTAAHTFTETGTHTVTLSVRDRADNEGSDTVTITVEDTTPPTAEAGAPIIADEDEAVSFDGTATTDDTAIETYAWDFDGDGTTDATGPTPTHTFTSGGTYNVTLTVTDGSANVATDTVPVDVRERYGSPAVASTHAVGTHSLGTTATTTLTVANDGQDTLSVTDLRVTGTDAADVSLEGNSSFSLAPNDSRRIDIEFAPTAPGPVSAAVTFETDAPARPRVSVPLTGRATAPVLSVAAVDDSMGSLALNDTLSRTIPLENTGSEPLSVGPISLDGGTDAYTLTAGGAATTLAPGERHTVTVTFAPTAAGTHETTLVVPSDDYRNRTATVPLSGSGVESPLSLSATTHAFETVSRGNTSTKTITVSNALTRPVPLTDIAVTGANANAFSVAGPETVPADGNATVTVTFGPTAADEAGSATATLAIERETGVVQTVSLAGTVGAPALSVGSDTLSFDEVTVGETETRQVTVHNSGTEPATVTGLTLSDNGPFTALDRAPVTVPAGATRTIRIAFEPTTTGRVDATLSVESDDPTAARLPVALSGTAVAPEIDVSSSSLGFGEVETGETVTRTVTVSNPVTSPAPLTITRISIVGRDAAAFDTAATGTTLAPGDRLDVPVTLTPESGGRKMAVLQVMTNAPGDRQVDIWLSNLQTVITVEETTTNQSASATESGSPGQSLSTGTDAARVLVAGNNVPSGVNLSLNVSQPSTRTQGAALDVVDLGYRGAKNFTMNITHTRENPSTTVPDFTLDGTGDSLGYIEVEHSFSNAEIDRPTFRVRVRKDRVEAMDASPQTVSFARHHDGEWQSLDPTLLAETTTHYIYRVPTPGFSLFSLGAPQPSITVTALDTSAAASDGTTTVTVDATVTNTGGAAGDYTVALERNGTAVANRTVTVPAEDAVQVSFRQVFDQQGRYAFAVGNRTTTVTIAPQSADGTATAVAQVTETAAGDQPPDTERGRPPVWLLGVVLVVGSLSVFVLARRRDDEGTDEPATRSQDDR